jgi:hypothetical protein
VIGIIGIVVAVLVPVGLARRQRGGRPAPTHKVPTIGFWRPRSYKLALVLLDEFIKRWEDGEFDRENRRGLVTEYDLIRWIIQLVLTCAANIVPQSLGRASLFRIGEITRDGQSRMIKIRVYSFELGGIFSLRQMINKYDHDRMRDLSIMLDQEDGNNHPAALSCVNKGPFIESLLERSTDFDDPERDLGVTHILAIPLRRDLSHAQADQPVSITVDLRFGPLSSYLVDVFHLHHRTLLRRAELLSKRLARVSALHRPEFLPPPTPDRDPPDDRP